MSLTDNLSLIFKLTTKQIFKRLPLKILTFTKNHLLKISIFSLQWNNLLPQTGFICKWHEFLDQKTKNLII